MFSGQTDCFCCVGDEDPPCTPCEACTGDAAGDCEDKVCPSFVITVEGFANTTTDLNCEGYTATGTECGAYNGTHVLDATANPCIFRSVEFTATVPIYLEINGIPCFECENVPVYYELEFLAINPPTSFIRICKASDGIPFAVFNSLNEDVESPIAPVLSTKPPNASLCHQEGIEQAMNSPYWPPFLVMWRELRKPESDTIPWPLSIGNVLTANLGGSVSNFCGPGDIYGSGGVNSYDQCHVDTEFDAFPAEGTQLARIMSPHWVCCRDESWDCDFVRDEIAKGNHRFARLKLLRITSIQCGT